MSIIKKETTANASSNETARKVLQDTEKLVKRTLHLAPMLKFYVNFLLGNTNLRLFYEKVLEF